MIGVEKINDSELQNWKKVEIEVLRDKNGNGICIGSREIINNDISCVPTLTITNRVYQSIRYDSIELANDLKIIGNLNAVFAINPVDNNYKLIKYTENVENSIIEKAVNYPMEKVLKKLKSGSLIDEIEINDKNACEELMMKDIFFAIEGTYYSANNLENAILKTSCLNKSTDDFFKTDELTEMGKDGIEVELEKNNSEIFFVIAEAIRKEFSVEKICQITKIDKFFVGSIYKIVKIENELSLNYLNYKLVEKALEIGLSEKTIAFLSGKEEKDIKRIIEKNNI